MTMKPAPPFEEDGDDPAEWVGTSLSPQKVREWKRLFGTTPSGPRGHYNPHGLLAAMRHVLTERACKIALENDGLVVDVGAAPHRTFPILGDRGRYLMPRVVVGDVTRRNRAPSGSRDFICDHKFEQCGCHEQFKRTLLLVHSAYYLDNMVLWRVLNDPDVMDCLVVEHTFSDMYGGFYDEAHWYMSGEVVTMTVVGNGMPYEHRLPPWQSGWVGDGGEAFAYDVLEDMDGVTRLIRVRAVQQTHVVGTRVLWGEVEANVNKAGPVQFSSSARNAVADNARFTQITFDVDHIYKFGPVLYTDAFVSGTRTRVTIPVNLVSEISRTVLNRVRTPELFAEISHTFRNRMARSRMPVHSATASMTAALAIGFITNIENEVNVTHTMTTRFSWLMDVHSVLLQFGKVTVRSWRWILFGSILGTIGFSLFETFDTDDEQRVVGAIVTACLFVLCFWCFRLGHRVNLRWRDYLRQTWVSSYGDDNDPRVPLLGAGYVFPPNMPLPASRLVKALPPVVQGSVTLDTTREKVAEPTRLLLCGPIVDGALPTALASTQDAELSAVRNRIVSPRRNPAGEALSEYKRAYDGPVFKMDGVKIDTSQVGMEAWLAGQSKKYPKTYVDNLRETWLWYQGCEIDPTATKGFLKIEKSAKTTKIDEANPTKPRLVQPPEDIDKAILGPVVEQLARRIRKEWDGMKARDGARIMYCSGFTNEQIGMAVDSTLLLLGRPTAWSVDMASYDATLGLELQKPALEFYKRLGAPAWMESWFMRIRSRGKTPNGVIYMPTRRYWFMDEPRAEQFVLTMRKMAFKVKKLGELVATPADVELNPDIECGVTYHVVEVEDFQMTSGRMDTNLTDTVVLVAALTARIPPGTVYLLLVCGDDGFLLLDESDAHVVESIKDLCHDLGLNPEGAITSDRAKWEFCSKLFWYAREKGRDFTVLGSKPFRGIARMGIKTTLPGAQNAAAAALSVRQDSGHVPFLAPFADRVHELCKEKKVRPTGRPEWTAIKPSRRFESSPLNYVIVQARYGLGEENENEFKASLRNLREPTEVLSWTPAVSALSVDEA